MTVLDALRDRLGRKARRAAGRRRPAPLRPRLEGLEGRVALTVSIIPTSTTLAVSPAESQPYGTDLTLTATVTAPVSLPGNSGSVYGTVAFYDNYNGSTIYLGTAVSLPSFTLDISSLPAGTNGLYATYSGFVMAGTAPGSGAFTINDFTPSTSSIVTETIDPSSNATTTTTVAPSVPGPPNTIMVTVAETSDAATPQGMVQFLVDGTPSGPPVGLSADGTVAFDGSTLPAGTHTIEADFSGGVGAASSGTASVTVAATTTTLAASAASAAFGQPETLTATVAPVSPGAGTPTGIVTFFDGATALGTGTLSVVGGADVATLQTASLAAGAHTITASYGGDAGDRGSTSAALPLRVAKDATIVTTVPTSFAGVLGQVMSIEAIVAAAAPGSGTPGGTVTFRFGWGVIATVPLITSGGQAHATLPVQTAAIGTYTITASYDGDARFLPGSAPVAFSIGKDVTTVAVRPSDLTPAVGESVAITATVAVASPGSGTPTGTVTFKSGPIVLITEPVIFSNGVYSAQIPALPFGKGSYAITAVYNGDATDAPSTATTAFVVKNATVTPATALAPTAAFGQSVTLVAAVDVSRPGMGTATGMVKFMEGSTVLGMGTLALFDGTPFATFTTTTLSASVHRITAVYGGDAWDNAGSSAAFTVTVGGGPAPIQRTDAVAVVRHDADLQQVAAGGDNVVFFGDSITDWWATGAGASVWSQNMAGLGAADFGVASDTAESLLWRIENGELADNPKMAVVQIGTNDLGNGRTVDYTARAIEAVVEEIRQISPSTQVVLMGLFPRGTATDPLRQKIKQVNDELDAWAGQLGVPFLDIDADLTAADGSISSYFLPDLLHPNASGYKIWAQAIGA
jgi:lysophospholipase L1-like esterase